MVQATEIKSAYLGVGTGFHFLIFKMKDWTRKSLVFFFFSRMFCDSHTLELVLGDLTASLCSLICLQAVLPLMAQVEKWQPYVWLEPEPRKC